MQLKQLGINIQWGWYGGHQHMGFFNHGPFTGARSFVRAVPK